MSTIEVQQTLPTGTWIVDGAHSQVGFAVDYMAGTFRGTFTPVEAQLAVGEDGSVALAGSTSAASIRVQDDNLGAHLLSPDFFDAERTPAISFSSTDVERSGDDVVVRGELTIRGISRPVELRGTLGGPIVDPYGKERIVLTLAGTIDRTEFGLNWNLPLPSGEPALANDVDLSAELYLVKA